MKVRRIDLESDYHTLKRWWELRGTAAPPVGILPAVGVIAIDERGVPVACAWLYEDKAERVGMVEWETTNPSFSAFACLRALNMIFGFFEAYWCGNHPDRVLFSWTAEGRGDGRLLAGRKWNQCPGERHSLMVFSEQPTEAPCPQ